MYKKAASKTMQLFLCKKFESKQHYTEKLKNTVHFATKTIQKTDYE